MHRVCCGCADVNLAEAARQCVQGATGVHSVTKPRVWACPVHQRSYALRGGPVIGDVGSRLSLPCMLVWGCELLWGRELLFLLLPLVHIGAACTMARVFYAFSSVVAVVHPRPSLLQLQARSVLAPAQPESMVLVEPANEMPTRHSASVMWSFVCKP